METERLDGFTSDGFGNVIPGNPVDGDVIRVDGRIEKRFTAFTPLEPTNPPQPTKSELLAKVQELVDAVSALPDEEAAD